MTSTTDLIDSAIWSLSLDDKIKVWELIEQLVKESQLPQQEISDEKILDAAEEHSDSFLNRGVAMSSFAGGCYWYREQLKKK